MILTPLQFYDALLARQLSALYLFVRLVVPEPRL